MDSETMEAHRIYKFYPMNILSIMIVYSAGAHACPTCGGVQHLLVPSFSILVQVPDKFHTPSPLATSKPPNNMVSGLSSTEV
jgi:hypothetical protein